MKKYLSIISASLLTASALAQGTVNFVNTAASLIKYAPTPESASVALPTTLNGRTHLVWAPVGQSISTWVPSIPLDAYMAANSLQYVTGNPATVTPTSGRFTGGIRTANGLNPSGAIIQALVIGWAGDVAYASYDAAFFAATAGGKGTTTWIGVSGPFNVDTGDPTTVPAGTAGSMAAFTGLTLVAVPEPTSFALVGLGAAALLIFRRRD